LDIADLHDQQLLLSSHHKGKVASSISTFINFSGDGLDLGIGI